MPTIQATNSLVVVVDVQQRLIPVITDHRQVIHRCTWLLNLAKALGVPAIAMEQNPAGLGPVDPGIRGLLEESHIYSKQSFSGTRDSIIRAAIEEYSRNQIIMVGMEAHVCVLQMALDLIGQNRQVFLIDDGIGSRRPSDKNLAVKRLRSAGAVIASPEMILFEWLESAEHPQFRTLTRQFIEKADG